MITFTLDDLLMLLGENWCWSLMGPKGLKRLCHGCLVNFVFMPMACQWQNHRLASIDVSKHSNMDFEKVLGHQVFRKHNCNPFQSSSSLSIVWLLLHSLCYFLIMSNWYFHAVLSFVTFRSVWVLIISWHSSFNFYWLQLSTVFHLRPRDIVFSRH